MGNLARPCHQTSRHTYASNRLLNRILLQQLSNKKSSHRRTSRQPCHDTPSHQLLKISPVVFHASAVVSVVVNIGVERMMPTTGCARKMLFNRSCRISSPQLEPIGTCRASRHEEPFTIRAEIMAMRLTIAKACWAIAAQSYTASRGATCTHSSTCFTATSLHQFAITISNDLRRVGRKSHGHELRRALMQRHLRRDNDHK